MKSISNSSDEYVCPLCGNYVDPRDMVCYNCDEDEVIPMMDIGVSTLHRGDDASDSAED